MNTKKESIFYVQGGARAWITTADDWEKRFPGVFAGMKLVAGEHDILLRFNGTNTELGNVFLQLQREPVGPRLSIKGRTLEPRPPLDVTPYVVEVLKDNPKLWKSSDPGDAVDGFVEIEVKRPSWDDESSRAHLDAVAKLLMPMKGVDYLARIQNRQRLLAHVHSKKPQRFDEMLLSTIHMHEQVKSTRTFFVLNRPLVKGVKVLDSLAQAPPEKLDTLVFIGVGHRSAPDILQTWDEKPRADASIVYSETDIIRRFPHGQGDPAQSVFEILTEGLGEDERTPASVRVLQARPVPLREAIRPTGGVRAYVLIDVKGHGSSKNSDLLQTLQDHDAERFEYLADVVGQPLLVGRVRTNNKAEMDAFVMHDLRSRHGLIRSTVTYIIVEDDDKPAAADTDKATALYAKMLSSYPDGLEDKQALQAFRDFCKAEGISLPNNPDSPLKRAKSGQSKQIEWRSSVSRYFAKNASGTAPSRTTRGTT